MQTPDAQTVKASLVVVQPYGSTDQGYASDSGFQAANFEALRGFSVAEVKKARALQEEWVTARAKELEPQVKRDLGTGFLSLVVMRAIDKPMLEAIQSTIKDERDRELGAGTGFAELLEAMICEQCHAYEGRRVRIEARQRAEREWYAFADQGGEA